MARVRDSTKGRVPDRTPTRTSPGGEDGKGPVLDEGLEGPEDSFGDLFPGRDLDSGDLAHDVSLVFEEAVFGTKDPGDPVGDDLDRGFETYCGETADGDVSDHLHDRAADHRHRLNLTDQSHPGSPA